MSGKRVQGARRGVGTHFTDEILERRALCLKNVKKAIYEHNREQPAVKFSVKAPYYR